MESVVVDLGIPYTACSFFNPQEVPDPPHAMGGSLYAVVTMQIANEISAQYQVKVL